MGMVPFALCLQILSHPFLLYFALLPVTLLCFQILYFASRYFALLPDTLLCFQILCFASRFFALLPDTLLCFQIICFASRYFSQAASTKLPDSSLDWRHIPCT